MAVFLWIAFSIFDIISQKDRIIVAEDYGNKEYIKNLYTYSYTDTIMQPKIKTRIEASNTSFTINYYYKYDLHNNEIEATIVNDIETLVTKTLSI